VAALSRGQEFSMPEHVVYLLGAGFSAPAGLPVMANFVSLSKDQFASSSDTLQHYARTYEIFDRLAKVKNFYATDLSNIEEILSILAVNDVAEASTDRETFVQYLVDVVERATPTPSRYPGKLPSNWRALAFGEDRTLNDYGNFVLSLTRRGTSYDSTSERFSHSAVSDGLPTYSIITLNYDCLLERTAGYIRKFLGLEVNLARNAIPGPDQVCLAKLHGCTSDASIVPPTWSKGSVNLPTAAWKAALHELGRANHIRILGYSLPASDLNVRYLLKAAALRSFHLKTIHVGTLDHDGETEGRYNAFIDHPGYRFSSFNIGHYLGSITDQLAQHPTATAAQFLESVHRLFVLGPAAT
jgi:SIR2-like domain